MGPRSCSRGAFDVPIEGFALFGGDFVKRVYFGVDGGPAAVTCPLYGASPGLC
jgi:hypothetical protein